jgi:hypothetical protein
MSKNQLIAICFIIGGCGSTAVIERDGGVTEDGDPGDEGHTPGPSEYCGDDADVPCCPDSWVVEREGPEFELLSCIEPVADGAVLWKGIAGATPDQMAVHIDETLCTAQSVITTEVGGTPQEQFSTLDPEDLEWLATDTELTLHADGSIALDDEGRIVWALHYQLEDVADLLSPAWLEALPVGWAVSVPDAPVCRRFTEPCWLWELLPLQVTTPVGSHVLDPLEDEEVQVDGMRYRIRNSVVAQRSLLLEEQCADVRFAWTWEIVALGPVP